MAAMAKKNSKRVRRTIVSIGSSHVAAALVEWSDQGAPNIVNFRESGATSLFRGQPTSVDQLVDELRALVKALGGAQALGSRDVHVLVSHSHIKQYEFETGLKLGLEHDQIGEKDVRSVHEQTCRVINIPLNERIIASHVQEYTVNDLGGIRNPVGLAGERLAVKLALFTVPYILIQQIGKVFERCEIGVRSWYPRSLATAKATFGDANIRVSSLLIEVGSTLTELIGFENYGIPFYQTLPVGIETVAGLMQEAHSLERQDALALTEQYATFGARTHGEEKIPFRLSGGKEQGFVTSAEFNTYLEGGLSKIVEELSKTIDSAIPNFRQIPKLYISGRGVNLGQLIERLEKRCGSKIEIVSMKHENIGHSSLCSAPLLGRGIILREDEESEKKLRKSIHPVKKLTGVALEWMREHF